MIQGIHLTFLHIAKERWQTRTDKHSSSLRQLVSNEISCVALQNLSLTSQVTVSFPDGATTWPFLVIKAADIKSNY